MNKYLILLFIFIIGCAGNSDTANVNVKNIPEQITSGEVLNIEYSSEYAYDNVEVSLKIKDQIEPVETYGIQNFNSQYTIRRFANKNIFANKQYYLEFVFFDDNRTQVQTYPVNIGPSVIVNSLCSSDNCETLSGNVIENVTNNLTVSFSGIMTTKVVYTITTPYESISYEHDYPSPVNVDWLNNIAMQSIPEDVQSYIALIDIKAYDESGEVAQTQLPFKVVRPIEVKHYGQYELAEIYEPIPVTGCIPGTVGNSVQYSESQSETRQNSVSITFNKSWSDSFSSNTSSSISEGVSVNETQGTVSSSSLSESETQSESFSNAYSQGESSNISFSTSDGENWSWSLGESQSETQGNSQTESGNTTVNGSTSVGVSGEGSLPFLAKASGKVEVSAGIARGWGNSESTSESNTSGTSTGYSTGGSSQNGRSYGSVQNDSRSHSLSGSYVLSSSVSNSLSESSSLSSGRVWNMSESTSSGQVVTEGNGESLSETIVSSSSSSTTFSYGGYIPRGRYGMFFRQTSRYVRLSEIITYTEDGYPIHAGYIMMNTWAWAPELSVSNTCEDASKYSLPEAECLIQPCGE